MLLDILITLLIAMLSGLGVGSAGLLVTFLVLVREVPQITAQSSNLVFFLFSSGAALLIHVFRTPLLGKFLLLLIPTGLIGSLLGVSLAGAMPEALLRRLFGVLLILLGSLGLFAKKKEKQAAEKNADKQKEQKGTRKKS